MWWPAVYIPWFITSLLFLTDGWSAGAGVPSETARLDVSDESTELLDELNCRARSMAEVELEVDVVPTAPAELTCEGSSSPSSPS